MSEIQENPEEENLQEETNSNLAEQEQDTIGNEQEEEVPVKRREKCGRKIIDKNDSTTLTFSQVQQLLSAMVSNSQKRDRPSNSDEEISDEEDNTSKKKKKEIPWSEALASVSSHDVPEYIERQRRTNVKPKSLSTSLSFIATQFQGRGYAQLLSGNDLVEFNKILNMVKGNSGFISVLAGVPYTQLKSMALMEEFKDIYPIAKTLECVLASFDDIIPPAVNFLLLGILTILVKRVEMLYRLDSQGKVAKILHNSGATGADYDNIEKLSKANSLISTVGTSRYGSNHNTFGTRNTFRGNYSSKNYSQRYGTNSIGKYQQNAIRNGRADYRENNSKGYDNHKFKT